MPILPFARVTPVYDPVSVRAVICQPSVWQETFVNVIDNKRQRNEKVLEIIIIYLIVCIRHMIDHNRVKFTISFN